MQSLRLRIVDPSIFRTDRESPLFHEEILIQELFDKVATWPSFRTSTSKLLPLKNETTRSSSVV